MNSTHLTAQPDDMITAGFTAATRKATAPEPRTFTIQRDWDVTEAHGAPDAHTYGQCQAAANLAACMGSRGSYTTVDGVVWHMERQEPIGPQDATWLAVDVTAVRQFDLMG
jgi:hypothetical protein